MKMYGLRHSA